MWTLFLLGGLVIFMFIFLFSKKESYTPKKDIVDTLSRQAHRWAVASKQDMNPVIKVLHANYAAGYLWALDDIASESEIEASIETSYKNFRHQITNIQEEAVKALLKECPQIDPTI